ncbi:hypothetical protein AaE_013684 [Aphanomyces astaci]|uniref:non-specific serine/threonine protein kinase n=1 Tax=Aphanomyces astaci TaxID=112090 RepID=A0A6A4Z691_APHAT|nr:hypothetical protein AaE_013684 [Aphanomyces astaci]
MADDYKAFPGRRQDNMCTTMAALPASVTSRLLSCFSWRNGASSSIAMQSGRRVVIDTDLAEGGFSFVYVVHDVDTMEQFAMKKIPCQSSEQRQLVSHELGYRMLLIVHNKCRHKHLMPLVDYAVVHTAAPDTSTYFLVFPLVENGSLRQYIDSFRSRQAFMPERAVVDIFVKVSQAVAFLHAQEPCLVHRDIKPENILLDHDLDPILTDFGSVIQGDVAILTRSDALKAQEVAAIHSTDDAVDLDALGVNADQYGALLRAFSKYDKMKTGTIRVSDFDLLSKELGETFDEDEMLVAKRSLEDPDGDYIQFSVFLKWWVDDTTA